MGQDMRGSRRGRRLPAEGRRWLLRASAIALLAAAGFAAAISPHALGGPTQTGPEPTTTAPPPDPAPTTSPRPDPAPPPPPPPPRPAPAPQPPPPPPPPAPPPAPPATELSAPPSPPARSAPVASTKPVAPRPPAPVRPRRRVVPANGARPAPPRTLTPEVAAIRFGERVRSVVEGRPQRVPATELVAASVSSSAGDGRTAGSVASLAALLGALGLGALLLTFSAVPDTVLARGPHAVAVLRARVEIGLLGAAIVVLVGAVFLVAAP
jgi:hypothetical protein